MKIGGCSKNRWQRIHFRMENGAGGVFGSLKATGQGLRAESLEETKGVYCEQENVIKGIKERERNC